MRSIIYKGSPTLPPHVCSSCSAGFESREYLVDTNISLDYHGVVYVCDDCFRTLVVLSPDNHSFIEMGRLNEEVVRLKLFAVEKELRFVEIIDKMRFCGFEYDNHEVTVEEENVSGPGTIEPDDLAELDGTERETDDAIVSSEPDHSEPESPKFELTLFG